MTLRALDDVPALCDVADAAARLAVSEDTIRRLADRGELVSYDVGAAVRRYVECWSIHGEVAMRSPYGHTDRRRWKPDATPDPLGRNRAMVAYIATAYLPEDVYVLALHAPWATTAGTAHTVGLARRAGIAVEEHVCPAEHGPRGGER